MNPPSTITTPPSKPLLLYDGDCKFCCRWIRRWERTTGPQVSYLPFQDSSVPTQFPELSREAFEKSVHLLEPDGRVSRGAEAVFRSLATARRYAWLLWCYQFVPGLAALTEWGYRRVANNRMLLSKLSRTK